MGAVEAEYSATAPLSEVPKTATYTHTYAQSNGFLTLLSDGQRLNGAYALGPEAGEWMQQVTLAVRALGELVLGRSGERADGSLDQAHHDLLRRDARTDRRDGLLPAHAPGM